MSSKTVRQRDTKVIDSSSLWHKGHRWQHAKKEKKNMKVTVGKSIMTQRSWMTVRQKGTRFITWSRIACSGELLTQFWRHGRRNSVGQSFLFCFVLTWGAKYPCVYERTKLSGRDAHSEKIREIGDESEKYLWQIVDSLYPIRAWTLFKMFTWIVSLHFIYSNKLYRVFPDASMHWIIIMKQYAHRFKNYHLSK